MLVLRRPIKCGEEQAAIPREDEHQVRKATGDGKDMVVIHQRRHLLLLRFGRSLVVFVNSHKSVYTRKSITCLVGSLDQPDLGRVAM